MDHSSGTGIGRVPTGVPGLDTILNGGFLTGGVYIVQGAPGTGKTTLANQVVFNHAAHGGQALYTTLLAEYHGRMMQHLGGMSFFDVSKIPDQVKYLNGFGTLRADGYSALRDLLRREITAHQATMPARQPYRRRWPLGCAMAGLSCRPRPGSRARGGGPGCSRTAADLADRPR